MIETTSEPIPAILDLELAIEEFRATVTPLLDPAQEENWDGTQLKAQEQAILLAGLRWVGHCIALLIYQLVLTESVKVAANVRAPGVAGLHYVNQAFKEVTITLIGGVQVRVPALYKLSRKSKQGRGGSQGQGFYPVLVLLGIGDGVSPLVRCLVAQAATQTDSFEQARPMVAWLGLGFSTRRIRRISRAFCRVGLHGRAARKARLAAGTGAPGEGPAGRTILRGRRFAWAERTDRHG